MKERFRKRLAVIVSLVFLMQSVFFASPQLYAVYAETDLPAAEAVIDTGEETEGIVSDEVDQTDPAQAGGDALAEEQISGGEESEQPPAGESAQPLAAPAAETDEPEPVLRANANGLTVLAFSSDVHNGGRSSASPNDTAANRTGTWIDKMFSIYGTIDLMSFCGDMGSAYINGDTFWTYSQHVMTVVDDKNVEQLHTTGNHEYMNGSYTNGANATTRVYKEDQQGVEGSNYRIYCLGSTGGSWNTYQTSQISALTAYMNSVGNEKPIFVISHYPLHFISSRTISGAGSVIDALNNAATNGTPNDASDDKKIVYLWGHNHTDSDVNYDQIFAPGDTISDQSGSSKTIDFYYGAAGCMSDSEYGTGSAYVKGKGLIVTINSKNQLSFTYYDENGNNVTEGGTYTEQDPVPVEGVSITDTGGHTLTGKQTVEARKTLKLSYAAEPADATVKSASWTSSDTGVATVSSSGVVKGVSEGTATITVTLSDGLTRGTATASIDVEVTPASSEEQYYVITIDNYALSSHASSEVTTNSSGYEYHGLEAVTYSADDAAPYSILWTLEEVDGVENGYYIKSYNGDYLSATYVRGSGSGYTGTLTVGDTQDVWIINGGIESWQGEGGYLKSTNASDNPRPADIYLTTRASDNSVDFFTVGSSSNYKTSKLVEPDAIIEPVAVTGIILDPVELTIEAGKSAAVTATVLPADADDKTVTWTSADEGIATVNNAGRVRGVAAGTTTITATTNDGGKTATCEVTVTPRTTPSIGYVITIGDYALSVNPSSDVLVNSSNYRYTGLSGVEYDGTAEADDEILWLFEETEGGYYIKSLDGQYLNAVYEPTYNTSGSQNGCNATLKLDDTPDVWTLEGSLEDWVLSGSTLTSTNAGKSMTHEEGSTGAPLNLFTVRTTGEESSMIDPDNPAEVRFIETNAFSDGKDYIVAVTKDGSSVYAIANNNGTTSGNTGSESLSVAPASGNDPAYIVTDNANVVWRYTSSNRYLANIVGTTSKYLSRSTSGTTYVPRTSGSGSAVTYSDSNQRFSISYSNRTYYLTNSSGTFGLNTSSSSAAQVRLFEKSAVFNFKYIVQFVSNGVNYQATKYAAGETPVYSGATPTREETALYTYTFSGWSSDGGVTVYGPEEDLPAVTGAVTYAAQFTAVPKPADEFTVTFNTNGGSVVEAQTVTEGGKAVKPEDPAKEGCFEFGGWYSDESLTETFDFDTAITEDTTLYAKWNEKHTPGDAVHENEVAATCSKEGSYDEVVYCTVCHEELSREQKVTEALGHDWEFEDFTWTGSDADGYTAAVANYKCRNDATHTTTVEATVTPITTNPTCTADGKTVYTASVSSQQSIDEVAHTDSKTVVIKAAGHTPGDAVHENEVAASCTAAGSYDEVVYCTVCNEELSRETVATEALGHNWGEWTVTIPATETAEGVETRICARCGESETRPIPMISHTHKATKVPAKAVSCTEDGNIEYWICDQGDNPCGKYFSDEACTTEITAESVIIKATGHTPGDAVHENEVAATCSKEGSYDEVVYCTVCHEELSRVAKTTEALGHDWEFVDFTWTGSDADGYTAAVANYKCRNDATHTTTVEATVTPITTNPTCTADGKTVYTASVSSQQSIDEVAHTDSKTVVIKAAGHTPGDAVHENEVAASCTAAGSYDEVVYCTVCHEELSRETVATEALGHNWGEWTVTTPATETAEGVETRTCARCGESETRAIPVISHTHAMSHVYAKAAGCTEDGNIEYWICDQGGNSCGKYFSDANGTTEIDAAFVVIAKTGHQWKDSAVLKEATCEEDGSMLQVCEHNALHMQVIPIDKTGHSMSHTGAVGATCAKDGNIEYWTCSKCGKYFSDEQGTAEITAASVVVKATGAHSWDEGTVTEATCEEDGMTTYTCSVCGETKNETIPALGHDWGEAVPLVEPGCKTAGVNVITCGNDEEHVKYEIVMPTGHDMSHTDAVSAACTKDGNTEYWYCDKCGKYFSDEQGTNEIKESATIVRATGHAWGEWTQTKAPTCTAEGEKTRVCANDENHKETVSLPAKGHSLVKAEAKEPTFTEDGNIEYWYCSICGELFLDADGTQPTTEEEVIIPAAGEKDLAKATIDELPDVDWTGKAHMPAVMVKMGGATLEEGTHYTVAYSNNTDPGTATVTITAVPGSGYTGTNSVSFKIKAPVVSKEFVLGGNTMVFKEGTYEKARLSSLARPYQLKLTARADKSMLLEWTNCANLGADIDGYIVMRRVGSETKYTEYVKVPKAQNYYYDKSITSANTNYYYIVLGYKKDSLGNITVSSDSMSVVGIRADSTKINPYTPTLNKTSMTMKVGDKQTLTLTYPKNAFSTWTRWRSDNSKVATVNSKGVVTAVGEGTTIISARTPNGRDIRCEITVNP